MAEYRKIPSTSENELDNLLYQKFISPVRTGYLEVGPQKYCLPENYLNFKQQIDDYEAAPGDIIVVTHPKTGTTWVHELLWLLQNNFDYEQATNTIPMERVPFLEVSVLFDVTNIDVTKPEFEDFKRFEHLKNSIDRTNSFPRPRLIKTHLPWELLPKSIRNATPEELNAPNGFKIVYVYRNAKDVCLSYFHHCCTYEGFTGTLEEFVKLFIAGKISYGPYFKHIQSCSQYRGYKNVMLISYEEMKKDFKSIIRQVAEFLGKSITEEDVDKLFAFLQFDNMKNLRQGDEFQYKFYRSGTVGSFKKEMSEEMLSSLNKWINTELEETKLDLPYLLIK